MKQYKDTVQTVQNTVNTGTRITKTSTHYKIHTYTYNHILRTKQPTHYTVTNYDKKWRYRSVTLCTVLRLTLCLSTSPVHCTQYICVRLLTGPCLPACFVCFTYRQPAVSLTEHLSASTTLYSSQLLMHQQHYTVVNCWCINNTTQQSTVDVSTTLHSSQLLMYQQHYTAVNCWCVNNTTQ
jgi:hypothetical protein